jgi:hypothetical protein
MFSALLEKLGIAEAINKKSGAWKERPRCYDIDR